MWFLMITWDVIMIPFRSKETMCDSCKNHICRWKCNIHVRFLFQIHVWSRNIKGKNLKRFFHWSHENQCACTCMILHEFSHGHEHSPSFNNHQFSILTEVCSQLKMLVVKKTLYYNIIGICVLGTISLY